MRSSHFLSPPTYTAGSTGAKYRTEFLNSSALLSPVQLSLDDDRPFGKVGILNNLDTSIWTFKRVNCATFTLLSAQLLVGNCPTKFSSNPAPTLISNMPE